LQSAVMAKDSAGYGISANIVRSTSLYQLHGSRITQ
jgi:hypothetical protein